MAAGKQLGKIVRVVIAEFGGDFLDGGAAFQKHFTGAVEFSSGQVMPWGLSGLLFEETAEMKLRIACQAGHFIEVGAGLSR